MPRAIGPYLHTFRLSKVNSPALTPRVAIIVSLKRRNCSAEPLINMTSKHLC